MGIKGWMLGLAAAGAAREESGIARYFFHRTVVREMKTGQDTEDGGHSGLGRLYSGYPRQQEWLAGQPQEDVYITSRDGLQTPRHILFAVRRFQEGSGVLSRLYQRRGLNDYIHCEIFYLNQGFNLMVVDERAHGKKQGAPISGLAVWTRYDALQWMEYVVERLGEGLRADASQYFHRSRHCADVHGPGASRTGKGRCVRLCLYLCLGSVPAMCWGSMYHMPAFPVMQIADRIARSEAGYGLDEMQCQERGNEGPVFPFCSSMGTGTPLCPVPWYMSCTGPAPRSRSC